MDRERVSAIARMGGKAAHAAGTAHRWTSEAAREAGRKGGKAAHVTRGGPRRRQVEMFDERLARSVADTIAPPPAPDSDTYIDDPPTLRGADVAAANAERAA